MDFTNYNGMVSNSAGSENGTLWGGAAGDQTGREWVVRNWFNGSWNCVLRYPDRRVTDLIAELAIEAAGNDNIGYDCNNGDRDTFWYALKATGTWHPKDVKTKCESNCSRGVTSIVWAVGNLLGIEKLKQIFPNIADIYTTNMRAAYSAAGFDVLTASKYLSGVNYLIPGDLLLSDLVVHHVCTNLGIGKYSDYTPSKDAVTDAVIEWQRAAAQDYVYLGAIDGDFGPMSTKAANDNPLEKGGKHTHMNVWLQKRLKGFGLYYGLIDGDFGEMTKKSVLAFQARRGLVADASVGALTTKALLGL